MYLRGVWEDEEEIHIVMEYCRGGELHHGLGRHPYTEAMVSTYMASVLQTIAQCHSRRILHRDIKPGNFMLLTKEKNSPLKAIDFGLAAFYSPDDLPRTDLGLDGTPWYRFPDHITIICNIAVDTESMVVIVNCFSVGLWLLKC